jgi:hypothetical protein
MLTFNICTYEHENIIPMGRNEKVPSVECFNWQHWKEAQNHWVSGLCLSSGILKSRKHTVSEIEPVSVFR